MVATQAAFAEADQGNWAAANRFATQISDPVAVKLLTWTRLLSDKSNATFAEIVAFREQNPGWPRMQLLAVRAETALLSYPMAADDILVWFGANPPQTGEGRIRYGETLSETGRETEGAEWIRRAWVENDFSSRRQSEILKAYGRYLTPEAQPAFSGNSAPAMPAPPPHLSAPRPAHLRTRASSSLPDRARHRPHFCRCPPCSAPTPASFTIGFATSAAAATNTPHSPSS